jgi:tetratricopeptide (TPR) repeat protein
MTAFISSILPTSRAVHRTFLCIVVAGFLAAPALAQNGGGDSVSQLKQAYKSGMQAAKQDNYETAYTQLERAHTLAKESEQSGAANQIQSYLQKLPKKWGNDALKNKNYSEALRHFEKGETHAPKDAYMLYGQGLALVNLDSTDTAMEVMSRAIEVGEANGDTRTAGLATERIRDEYISRASKALSAESPTQANAETALEALDKMREYVDANAKSLFYRSLAYDVQGNHQQAIETARRGLDMHQGSRSDEAKYHFVIAESQMRMGETQQACQTFQEAAFGDYKARSEHYLENECN